MNAIHVAMSISSGARTIQTQQHTVIYIYIDMLCIHSFAGVAELALGLLLFYPLWPGTGDYDYAFENCAKKMK